MVGDVIAELPTWVLVLMFWVVVWKAIASWKAARNDDLAWFVLFWALNTVGILPIIYILFFSKKTKKTVKKKANQ